MFPTASRRTRPLCSPIFLLLNKSSLSSESSDVYQVPSRANSLQTDSQNVSDNLTGSAGQTLVHHHVSKSDTLATEGASRALVINNVEGPSKEGNPMGTLGLSQSPVGTPDLSQSLVGTPGLSQSPVATSDLSQGEHGSLTGEGDDGTNRVKRKRSLCLPTVFIPEALQTNLKAVLAGHPRKSLVLDGESLTNFLLSRKVLTKLDNGKKMDVSRSTQASGTAHQWTNDDNPGPKKSRSFNLFKYGKREAIALAASRTQAIYGTTLRVLSEIGRREPSFRPGTMLDFGSGLGTAVWAAHQLWAESIYEYLCVDVSREMGDLARVLRGGDVPNSNTAPGRPSKEVIPNVYFRQYLSPSNKVQHDLVVSSHTLGEIPSVKLRRMFIASLWRKTQNFLVLIEPGNWCGFNIIAEARDMVLEASKTWTKYDDESSEELAGHVFAPCLHDLVCPLTQETGTRNPCHFVQRVQLSIAEGNGPLKGKGFRLENFSYVVLKKGERSGRQESESARILQPIKKRSKHIICKLCTGQGEVKEVILTKSKHKDLYKVGRKSKWGDVLPGCTTNTSDIDTQVP